jgi:hypothetical protein
MFIMGRLTGPAQLPGDPSNTFETAFARLQIRIETACRSEADAAWPARVAAGIRAALAFAASDPGAANALTNEALAQGHEGFARYDRVIAHFGEQLLAGRGLRPENRYLPEITERAMTGGIAMLIAQRLDQGCAAELPALAVEAIQFALTPYLGPEEARRVAVAACR